MNLKGFAFYKIRGLVFIGINIEELSYKSAATRLFIRKIILTHIKQKEFVMKMITGITDFVKNQHRNIHLLVSLLSWHRQENHRTNNQFK